MGKNKNKTPTTVGEGRGATNWNCRNLISNQSFLIFSGAKDSSKVRSVMVPDLPDLFYQSTCTWNSLSADQHFFVGFLCKVLWGSGFARLLLWELYFSVMGFQRMLLPHHVFCVLFTENFLW